MSGRKVSLEEIKRGLKEVCEAVDAMGDSLTVARVSFARFSARRSNPSGIDLNDPEHEGPRG
jgi:hypothetical protein